MKLWLEVLGRDWCSFQKEINRVKKNGLNIIRVSRGNKLSRRYSKDKITLTGIERTEIPSDLNTFEKIITLINPDGTDTLRLVNYDFIVGSIANKIQMLQ